MLHVTKTCRAGSEGHSEILQSTSFLLSSVLLTSVVF